MTREEFEKKTGESALTDKKLEGAITYHLSFWYEDEGESDYDGKLLATCLRLMEERDELQRQLDRVKRDG